MIERVLQRKGCQLYGPAALEKIVKTWAWIVKSSICVTQLLKTCVTMVAPLPPMFCAIASRA